MNEFDAVFKCSVALYKGHVLQVNNVSVGNGALIDWRYVKSGDTLMENADEFDLAHYFVHLVGPSKALEAVEKE